MLEDCGITQLYSHQHNAIQAIRDGRHVVTATPTASGKTVVYNIPFLKHSLENPNAQAIYLFPESPAQDHFKSFFRPWRPCSPAAKATAAVYDGDNSRCMAPEKNPPASPSVVLTNPEMLHLSFLQYHDKWRVLFENIEMVVVDEVHLPGRAGLSYGPDILAVSTDL
ncbi:MAG: DEAD/DEAH box helicase [Desulfobacterales bacterium]